MMQGGFDANAYNAGAWDSPLFGSDAKQEERYAEKPRGSKRSSRRTKRSSKSSKPSKYGIIDERGMPMKTKGKDLLIVEGSSDMKKMDKGMATAMKKIQNSTNLLEFDFDLAVPDMPIDLNTAGNLAVVPSKNRNKIAYRAIAPGEYGNYNAYGSYGAYDNYGYDEFDYNKDYGYDYGVQDGYSNHGYGAQDSYDNFDYGAQDSYNYGYTPIDSGIYGEEQYGYGYADATDAGAGHLGDYSQHDTSIYGNAKLTQDSHYMPNIDFQL